VVHSKQKDKMENYHIPVLLHESIERLDIQPNGVYVDVTFGGGGHSREILKRMENGRLFGFDQDIDSKVNSPEDERFTFIHGNFRFLRNFLRYYGVEQVDGIIADLGVSWHQFDTAERGFSFRFEGELDMRMNQNSALSAKTVLNTYTELALSKLFRTYGEIQNTYKLVQSIVNYRMGGEIKTIEQFLEIISACVPKHQEHKYLAQVFQSLRIEVNKEMESLQRFLLQTVDTIRPDGRLSVITYHSLEDRLVKNFMKTGKFEGEAESDIYGNRNTPFEPVNRKVIIPEETEIQNNSRARSAKLRIAKRRKND